MSTERVAIDLSDGNLAILGASGKGTDLEYREFFVKKIDTDDPRILAEEVSAYVARNMMLSPFCFLGLDSRSILMKSFFFPFRAAGKIEPALQFELEGALSVDKESLFVDWIYGPKVGSGTFVSAGCAEKELLDKIVEAFNSNGLKLAEITSASAALVGLPARQEQGSKLILDVGRERVVLLSVEDGVLQNQEILLKGLDDVISKGMADGRTFDQAYRSLYLTDFTQEDIAADAEFALNALKTLLRQIENYIHIYIGKTGFTPAFIEVCGEGLEVRGFNKLIESSFEINTFLLMPHELLTYFEDNTEGNCALRSYALLQGGKNESLSFLRDADRAEERGNYKNIKYAAKWFAVLFVSFMIFFGANIFHKSRVINYAEEKLTLLLQKSLPNLQGQFSYAQYISILKSRINGMKRKLINNSGGTSSAIEVLRVIHAAAGKKLGIKLDELTLNPRRTALSGTAGSFKEVEAFRTQLEKSKFFSAVKIKGATAEQKTKQIRFTLDLRRKTVED